jgi:hypothetical protein
MADYGMNHGEDRRAVNEARVMRTDVYEAGMKGCSPDVEPERVTIEQLSDSLEKALGMLREEVGMLGDRIDAVMGPSTPTDDAEKRASGVGLGNSSLACILLELTQRVYTIHSQVRDYRIRVQL